MTRIILKACVLGLTVLTMGGCAKAALDTTGFTLVDEATINAPLPDAWQLTKTVLRENELDVGTRDKRGYFVAWTQTRRKWRMVPRRTQVTVMLEEVSSTATRITVETVDQVYGVTVLTYPDWHDRKAQDNTLALRILEAVQAKASTV